VYSGIPAGGPTPGIFFTRWITHFVAPGFAFFAGTGAFFLGRKLGDPARLARFLVTRGLLLVVFELTLMRFAWSFSVSTEFMLAGVIWMLGWCMVLLGLVVRWSPSAIGWAGVGIVALQQLFNLPPRALGAIASPWSFIYNSPAESAPFGINVLYVIVPWIGVMMAGYGFGLILLRADADRRRMLSRLGWGMTAAFLVLGTAAVFVRGSSGEQGGGSDGPQPPFIIQLLNQQKYPASQLFLLMTLGPLIALMPWAERAKGWVADALTTIGRVPMFYYVAHLFVIHVLSIGAMLAFFGAFDPDWFATAPYTGIPRMFQWSLAQLYLVYAIALAILYPMCRWYASVKFTRPNAWMRYL
jgi:uncharacterized membrane protein